MAIVCLNVVMGLQHFVSISPAMTKWGFIVVGKKASIRVHVLPRSTGLGWCRDYCRGIEPYRGRMMTRGTRTTGAAPASSSLHRHRPHQPLQHLQLETQAVLTSKHSPFSQRHVCLYERTSEQQGFECSPLGLAACCRAPDPVPFPVPWKVGDSL